MRNVKGPLLVKITLINRTAGHRFAHFPPGRGFGPYKDLNELFGAMKQEWGGRVQSMYRDTKYGAQKIGWIFEKRMQYEDCTDTYLREAWVEVIREVSPTVAATYECVGIQ